MKTDQTFWLARDKEDPGDYKTSRYKMNKSRMYEVYFGSLIKPMAVKIIGLPTLRKGQQV